MATLNIYWNFVRANADVNLGTLARKSDTGISPGSGYIAKGNHGVLFRAVLTEEANFSHYLNSLTLEKDRRSRREGAPETLFRPKPAAEQTIGTLRIVRPKRHTALKGVTTPQFTGALAGQNMPTSLQASVAGNGSPSEFEVLLESTQFLLEEAQEQMAERFQLQETFHDFTVNFFGRRAEIFTYAGSLLNAEGNLQWKNQFLDDYERYLRGTRCAELKARAYLLYDDVVREGFILSASTAQNSLHDGAVKFSFTLLVTNKRILGVVPHVRTETQVNVLSRRATSGIEGVNDIRFLREDDPELPTVSPYTAGLNAGEAFALDELSGNNIGVTENTVAPLVTDPVFNGKEPLDDLKQAMLREVGAALDRYRQAGSEDSSVKVDHDILIAFIPADQLPTSTRRAASGGSNDPNNLSGAETVDALLNGSATPGGITLGDAIKAAKSFATDNAARVGNGELVQELGALASRLSNPTARITSPTPNTTDYAKEVLKPEAPKYVLQEAVDHETVDLVIARTQDLLDFDPQTVNPKVVDASTVSAFELFADNDPAFSSLAKAGLYYAAAFCLVRNTAGALFPEVLHAEAFPQAGSLGGRPDALNFVRAQKIKAFARVLSTLPPAVLSELSTARAAFIGTSLADLIRDKVVLTDDQLPVTEATLLVASSYDSVNFPGTPMAAGVGTFLHSVGAYISGLVAEVLRPAATIQPVSTDLVGGTLAITRGDYAKYFSSAYAQSLAPGQNQETVLVVQEADSPFEKAGLSGSYPRRPLGVILGDAYVTTLTLRVETPGPDEHVQIVAPTDPDDAILHSVGYPAFTGANVTEYSALTNGPRVMVYRASVRKTALQSPGEGGAEIIRDRNMLPLRIFKAETAFHAKKVPVDRAYLGGGTHIYGTPSIGNFIETVRQVGSAVQAASTALTERVARELGSLVENAEGLRRTDSARIQEEFALAKFAEGDDAIPEVQSALNGLEFVGVSLKDYLTLTLMVKAEAEPAKDVRALKERLTEAIAAANANPAGAQVAASDARSQEALSRQ